jgi:hypothetical protein
MPCCVLLLNKRVESSYDGIAFMLSFWWSLNCCAWWRGRELEPLTDEAVTAPQELVVGCSTEARELCWHKLPRKGGDFIWKYLLQLLCLWCLSLR